MLLRCPRIVCPDMPDMTFGIQTRESAPAVRFALDVLYNRRSRVLGTCVNRIGVLNDQAHPASLRTADFCRQFHSALRHFFIHRSQHDHAAAERQFGMHDGVAGTGIHGMFFESENAAHSHSIASAAFL